MAEQSERGAGFVLAIASILSVAWMSHHPVIDAHGMAEFLQQVVDQRSAGAWVHGVLIALALCLVLGLCGLSARLGWSKQRVRAALLCYVAGTAAMIGGAVINGFVTAGFALRYLESPPEELEAIRHVLAYSGEAVRTFERGGVLAVCCAVLLWSSALVELRGLARVVGLLGLLVAALPMLGLATGHLRMTVHGFGAFLLLQAAWNVLAGIWLVRRPR